MVRYLTIQKEKHPIRVSYYALKMLREELGRGINLNDDGSDYTAYESLLYWSLKKGHEKINPGKPFKFERDQMEDIMDEVYFEFMKIIPEFFSDELPATLQKKGASTAKK